MQANLHTKTNMFGHPEEKLTTAHPAAPFEALRSREGSKANLKEKGRILFNRALLLALISMSVSSTALPQAAKYTPANTSISFDLDKVLLKLDVSGAVWRHKLALVKSLARPKFLYKSIKRACSNRGSGEQWVYFFRENKADGLAAMVQDIANSKQLIAGTERIVHELHDLNYTLLHATNMGTQEFEQQKKRFTVMKCFSDGVAVPYHTKGIRHTRKPEQDYYALLLSKIPAEQKQFAIFIDDTLANVEAAKNAGMIGIHFKNPEQLRAELVKMGILK